MNRESLLNFKKRLSAITLRRKSSSASPVPKVMTPFERNDSVFIR